jgi:hypothetical protein
MTANRTDRHDGESSATVSDAAASGDMRGLLVAMRTRVAQAVESKDTSPRDLAALTRRLLEIAKDIEAIDAAEEEDEGDGSDTEDAPWSEEAL